MNVNLVWLFVSKCMNLSETLFKIMQVKLRRRLAMIIRAEFCLQGLRFLTFVSPCIVFS